MDLYPGYRSACYRFKDATEEKLAEYRTLLSDYNNYITVELNEDDSINCTWTDEGKKHYCSKCGDTFGSMYEYMYDSILQWRDMDNFADDLIKCREYAQKGLVEIRAHEVHPNICDACEERMQEQ